ncbi:hypothetical protein DSECCO2_661200 [anaerobic digester metagenome]
MQRLVVVQKIEQRLAVFLGGVLDGGQLAQVDVVAGLGPQGFHGVIQFGEALDGVLDDARVAVELAPVVADADDRAGVDDAGDGISLLGAVLEGLRSEPLADFFDEGLGLAVLVFLAVFHEFRRGLIQGAAHARNGLHPGGRVVDELLVFRGLGLGLGHVLAQLDQGRVFVRMGLGLGQGPLELAQVAQAGVELFFVLAVAVAAHFDHRQQGGAFDGVADVHFRDVFLGQTRGFAFHRPHVDHGQTAKNAGNENQQPETDADLDAELEIFHGPLPLCPCCSQ